MTTPYLGDLIKKIGRCSVYLGVAITISAWAALMTFDSIQDHGFAKLLTPEGALYPLLAGFGGYNVLIIYRMIRRLRAEADRCLLPLVKLVADDPESPIEAAKE